MTNSVRHYFRKTVLLDVLVILTFPNVALRIFQAWAFGPLRWYFLRKVPCLLSYKVKQNVFVLFSRFYVNVELCSQFMSSILACSSVCFHFLPEVGSNSTDNRKRSKLVRFFSGQICSPSENYLSFFFCIYRITAVSSFFRCAPSERNW